MSMKLHVSFLFVCLTFCSQAAVQPAQQPHESYCPPAELIAPCRCSQREEDIQVWCSHSDLPRVLQGIKSIAKTISRPIDELILENNQLPSLPGRFFAPLRVMRLMLRHNGLERMSNGWLNDLEDSLVEVFIVERDLRSIPVDSLMSLRKLEAVTIDSVNLKRVPIFSGLPSLKYIKIDSESLIELPANIFREIPQLETIQISGSARLNRLEAGLFEDLPKLRSLNVASNGISWIHLRALSRLPSLRTFELNGNKISDAGMVGRAIKDLSRLEVLRLDSNHITQLNEGSFVDLPALRELFLHDNAVSELHHGAFYRTPSLKLIHLENNFLSRVHPESFLQTSGSGVEYLHLQNNEIQRVEELRSLLDALPMLKFLDLSHNRLEEIPFGALRGHGTLEQLYLDHNVIRRIERDAFMAMPGLRELRLKNNSLSDMLPLPFWNLPGLKGLDLSGNRFKRIDPALLMGIPSLRRLDLSENFLVTLNPAAFENTPVLETINISRNELSMIHPATFRNLDRLFELDASYNSLQEIVPGLPRIVERISVKRNKITNLPTPPNKSLDLPNLRMLDLGGNLLQRLPRSAFKALSQLRFLSLAKNRLQTIDEASLVGLEHLEVLSLQDNRLMALHENSMRSLRDLRDLNIQGNRLELFVESILGNLPKLQRLDVSRNNIVEMAANAFASTRALQALDVSNNNLMEIPDSMAGLTELREVDISFNQLNVLSPEMLSSLLQLEELRASNNKVTTLPRGTFKDLPVLQYLDLSSNQLGTMESGSIFNLPQLQELVLADNQLVEIGDRACEDLPNLQAVHLQQNNLRYMSPFSFFRSPSIVYLNISSNLFENLEHVGLRSVRNLEVLDLSNNGIRRITTNPLRGLDWLVELKLDDNRICKVQGEPFSTMPRLRVLTMRNNKMTSITEPTFRSLRGNLAILDLDGNPLDCTCDMIWLRAWYQETDSLTHYPGPRCRDGTMLRESRLTRSECQGDGRSNQIPLTNEHGDVFQRRIDYSECEADPTFQEDYAISSSNQPPLAGESEYFYDQYVDYPLNDTNLVSSSNNTAPIIRLPSSNRPPSGINISNTILNYNKHKQQQQFVQQPPGSQFTFFGMPLPSLNMGNLWNIGRNANTRAATGTKGKARVQAYRPEDLELFKFVNRKPSRHDHHIDVVSRHRNPIGPGAAVPVDRNENNRYYYRPYFQTSFPEPSNIENGGFRPIVPGTGGFLPIQNPYANATTDVPKIIDPLDQPQSDQATTISESTMAHHWPGPYHGFSVTSTTIVPSSALKDQFRDSSRPAIVSIESSTIPANRDVQPTQPSKHPQELRPLTTISPLTNYMVDLNSGSRYEETELTTTTPPRSSFAASTEHYRPSTTTITTTTTIERLPITRSTASTTTTAPPTPDPLNKSAEIPTNVQSPDPWDNLNDSPSSLSALVAPGAQLGIYRSPPGRSTITKVFSSTPTPTAEEYHRTTSISQSSNQLDNVQRTTPATTHVLSASAKPPATSRPTARDYELTAAPTKRKTNMDWYFANYNKTVEDTFDPGVHRLRSSVGYAGRPTLVGWLFLAVIGGSIALFG